MQILLKFSTVLIISINQIYAYSKSNFLIKLMVRIYNAIISDQHFLQAYYLILPV
jgi:hypothetical protein